MPHFVIECNEELLNGYHSPHEIMRAVNEEAVATGLFEPQNIKVRIKPFDMYLVADEQSDFLHVFGNIMQGRTVEQKKNLSNRVVGRLKKMLPNCAVISMNVIDFEKATYCNRNML